MELKHPNISLHVNSSPQTSTHYLRHQFILLDIISSPQTSTYLLRHQHISLGKAGFLFHICWKGFPSVIPHFLFSLVSWSPLRCPATIWFIWWVISTIMITTVSPPPTRNGCDRRSVEAMQSPYSCNRCKDGLKRI